MSQINPELKNAIITIATHRVLLRAREEERKRRELLRKRTVLENLVGPQSTMNSGQLNLINLVNQARVSSEIANLKPMYPNHSVNNLFSYNRDVTTPTPTNTITLGMTTKDDREENDKTPTRASYEISSRAEFLRSFRETVSQTVKEGEIKQARRRSRETCEESPLPTTSSIIAIPEETPEEALMRTNLADTFEEEA